ncbi:MAG: LysM peptidoglycan-binding domain-containing protein, partial [Bacteroides sp.]|nr:LysM peptidoglycan-binding domain-containing protein [Bacteroides sp.]MCM1096324.1 LysM peptidoglycan-binding domain-containing protein [Terasakiella sp.]
WRFLPNSSVEWQRPHSLIIRQKSLKECRAYVFTFIFKQALNIMKRILLTLAILVVSACAMSAAVHVVQRGETLRSIAGTYNITTQQLVEANPGADTLFYVGLKLNIPEPAAAPAAAPAAGQPAPMPTEPAEPAQEAETSELGPGWTMLLGANYGFLEKAEGVKNTSHGALAFSFGGTYWVKERFEGAFASIGLGYEWITRSWNNFESRPYYRLSSDSDLHLIYLPVRFGYRFNMPIGKVRFGLSPYVGFDFGMTVAGKSERYEDGDKRKEKAKTGEFIPSFKPGLMVCFGDVLCIGFYYKVPMGKKAKGIYDKDGHFGLTLATGF